MTATFNIPKTDSTFIAPSRSVNAAFNCESTHAQSGRPSCKSSGSAPSSNSSTTSSVILLFTSGGPLTILWAIWPIIIDSFKGIIFIGTRAESVEKFCKRCKQELNTATAISRIFFAIRICASIFSSHINTVISSVFVVSGLSVSGVRFLDSLTAIASARHGFTLKQRRAKWSNLLTAITDTFPFYVSFLTPNDTCNQDASKSRTDQIFVSWRLAT